MTFENWKLAAPKTLALDGKRVAEARNEASFLSAQKFCEQTEGGTNLSVSTLKHVEAAKTARPTRKETVCELIDSLVAVAAKLGRGRKPDGSAKDHDYFLNKILPAGATGDGAQVGSPLVNVDARSVVSLVNRFYDAGDAHHGLRPYRVWCDGHLVETTEYALDEWLSLNLDLRTMPATLLPVQYSPGTWHRVAQRLEKVVRRDFEIKGVRHWNDPLYRLLNFVPGPKPLLAFGETDFDSYRFGPGLLDDELTGALAEANGDVDLVLRESVDRLPLRTAMVPTTRQLMDYGGHLCAGGVCVLLAGARSTGSTGDFDLVLHMRGANVTDNRGRMAVCPIGFHQPHCADADPEEARLYWSVLREIFEELIGRSDGESDADRHGKRIAHDWYIHEHPTTMGKLHANHRTCLVKATCFGLNASTAGYEFGILVVIDDPALWGEFRKVMGASWEHERLRIVSSQDKTEIARLLIEQKWAPESVPAFIEGLIALKRMHPRRVELPDFKRQSAN